MRFNKEKFLLLLLAGIFIFQAAIFTLGVFYCTRNGGLSACPEIGPRFDQMFNVMIATTLALLTGSAVASATKKKEEDEEPKKDPTQWRMGSQSEKKK